MMLRGKPMREVLRAAGEAARTADLSPACVARVRGEAVRLLAERPPVPAAVRPVWVWRPALSYGVAALLLAGVLIWREAGPSRAPAGGGAPVGLASAGDPTQLDRLVAERAQRLRDDLRAFQRRHLAETRWSHRSRADALAESLALRTGRMRAELH